MNEEDASCELLNKVYCETTTPSARKSNKIGTYRQVSWAKSCLEYSEQSIYCYNLFAISSCLGFIDCPSFAGDDFISSCARISRSHCTSTAQPKWYFVPESRGRIVVYECFLVELTTWFSDSWYCFEYFRHFYGHFERKLYMYFLLNQIGFMMDRYGRKATLATPLIPMIIIWIVTATCTNHTVLFTSRVFSGIFGGFGPPVCQVRSTNGIKCVILKSCFWILSFRTPNLNLLRQIIHSIFIRDQMKNCEATVPSSVSVINKFYLFEQIILLISLMMGALLLKCTFEHV